MGGARVRESGRGGENTPHPSPWWIECTETVGADQVLGLAAPSARHLVQLTPGRLRLRLFRLAGPGLELDGGQANLPLRAVGTTPPSGQATVSILLDAPGPCTMQGYAVTAGDALVWPPGWEYDGIAPAGYRWATTLVPDVIAETLGGIKAERARANQPELRVARLTPNMLDEVRALLDAVGAWREPEIADLDPRVCRGFRDRWYDLLEIVLRRAERAPASGAPAARALAVVRAVEEHWLGYLGQTEKLQVACDAVGASPRTVETAFHRVLGLSPTRYLATLRAHALFRELRRTDSEAPRTVGEAEARCGIAHPSRFAARYRSIFGENPSETFTRVQPGRDV
jgi:AraC-like DNA-binding protein